MQTKNNERKKYKFNRQYASTASAKNYISVDKLI